LAYFTHLKCQKRIGNDVGDLKYVFTKKKKNYLRNVKNCYTKLFFLPGLGCAPPKKGFMTFYDE
jgi:hypothetical protein